MGAAFTMLEAGKRVVKCPQSQAGLAPCPSPRGQCRPQDTGWAGAALLQNHSRCLGHAQSLENPRVSRQPSYQPPHPHPEARQGELAALPGVGLPSRCTLAH